MPHSLLTEASILDDSGVQLTVWHVDLREQRHRTPVTTLVKACRRAHAVHELGTIRVSRPVRFRNFGEGLIKDPAETRVSRTVVTSESVDDPDEMAEARRIDDELGRCAAAIGSSARLTTKSIKTTNTSSDTLTFGKNVWIYSTSIDPDDDENFRKWKTSLPESYDHQDCIHRPREFARALGLMVIEQLGPLCNEQTIRQHTEGEEPSHVRRKGQLIIHGPVIYTTDPYELVSRTSLPVERMLLPIFVKDIRYADQREYRFAIWAEDEPTEEYVDLAASKAMFGSLEIRANPPPVPVQAVSTEPDTELAPPASDERPQEGSNPRSEPSALRSWPPGPSFALKSNASPRVIPSRDARHLAIAVDETAIAEAALAALRQRIEDVEGDRRTRAASAAWHAEPYIRKLCSTFVDPIESVSMTDDDILVVALKIPRDVDGSANISFGPLGAHVYRIVNSRSETNSLLKPSRSFSVPGSLVDRLVQLGLATREKFPE